MSQREVCGEQDLNSGETLDWYRCSLDKGHLGQHQAHPGHRLTLHPVYTWESKTPAYLTTILPTNAKERKKFPVATGVLDYFPDAIIAVAGVSYKGNEQHNPGQPLHWDRNKSMDQSDTMIRHFLERGKFDTDGQRHSAKMAWRALAILQLEIEAERGK